MPTERPLRSASERIAGSIDMKELSGCPITEATATTGSFLAAAKNTSCSYETAKSLRPAATSLSGAEGSEGAWIATSRPVLAEEARVAGVVEADVIGVRRPVERERGCAVAAAAPAARGQSEDDERRARALRMRRLELPGHEQPLEQRDRAVQREGEQRRG